jgi:hypothetical protein
VLWTLTFRVSAVPVSVVQTQLPLAPPEAKYSTDNLSIYVKLRRFRLNNFAVENQ